jgi:hypothetical protein
MNRSEILLRDAEDQSWYAQIMGLKQSKTSYNRDKWALVQAFNGKTEAYKPLKGIDLDYYLKHNILHALSFNSPLKGIVNAMNFQAYQRHRALLFFNTLDEKGIDYTSDEALMRGYVMVTKYLAYRLRELKDWKPKSHNRYRVFSELVRHLFAKYPIPAFMDSAFMEKNAVYALWFIHLAQGRSVRKLPKCPIQWTTKIAHQFLQTPPQYSVTEALRFAQVTNMGGNERLVCALLPTRLGQSFEHDDFWQTVIRFFIQNPMLEHSHIQPIIDYIYNIKFENRMDVDPLNLNQQVMIAPEQPHFSMKGRTVAALLRAVVDWHRILNRTTSRRGFKEVEFWKPAPFYNFKHREGANDDNFKLYEITQLVTSAALHNEGRKLGHCVYSYTRACVQGRTSIWAMTVRDETDIVTPLLTIELSMPSNTIVQVRGKHNRIATESEMKVVNRWATKEGFAISKWVQ